jgi:hypothetical protein
VQMFTLLALVKYTCTSTFEKVTQIIKRNIVRYTGYWTCSRDNLTILVAILPY